MPSHSCNPAISHLFWWTVMQPNSFNLFSAAFLDGPLCSPMLRLALIYQTTVNEWTVLMQYSHILAILLFLTEHFFINCIAIQFFQSCNSSPNYFGELSINQSYNFSLISTCNAIIFFQSCNFSLNLWWTVVQSHPCKPTMSHQTTLMNCNMEPWSCNPAISH